MSKRPRSENNSDTTLPDRKRCREDREKESASSDPVFQTLDRVLPAVLAHLTFMYFYTGWLWTCPYPDLYRRIFDQFRTRMENFPFRTVSAHDGRLLLCDTSLGGVLYSVFRGQLTTLCEDEARFRPYFRHSDPGPIAVLDPRLLHRFYIKTVQHCYKSPNPFYRQRHIDSSGKLVETEDSPIGSWIQRFKSFFPRGYGRGRLKVMPLQACSSDGQVFVAAWKLKRGWTLLAADENSKLIGHVQSDACVFKALACDWDPETREVLVVAIDSQCHLRWAWLHRDKSVEILWHVLQEPKLGQWDKESLDNGSLLMASAPHSLVYTSTYTDGRICTLVLGC